VYPNYFGLKEPSFSITPDPQYLFLSEQHREALAHLLYGAGKGGGFVLLTGEVGTGKTTVCRAFLGQLPEGVDVALILNPAMTVTELLRAVCEELQIPLTDSDRTVKRLVDRLNGYLLQAHANGRRPLLLIDEAQNLRPKVLEQIRLLTNLETPKHKLLQIFLVGQPELHTLLEREGLRQLNQRITARYHLRPFSARETAEYIRHRLAVAGVERALFTRAAVRRVHRFSGGVPRLINILCDRALLGACVTRSPLVTKRIVVRAAREIRPPAPAMHRHSWPAAAGLAAAVLLAVALGWYFRDQVPAAWRPPIAPMLAHWFTEPAGPPAPAEAKSSEKPASAPSALVPVSTGPKPVQGAEPAVAGPAPEHQSLPAELVPQAGLARLPESPSEPPPLDWKRLMADQSGALERVLRRWGIELKELGTGDPCTRLASFGLRCERDQGTWASLRDFDRPAMIRVRDDQGSEGFAAVEAMDGDSVTFELASGTERQPIQRIGDHWTGDYLVVWQPPPVGTSIIGPDSSGDAVRWLRKLMSQLPEGGLPDTVSGTFDQALTAAVRRFQTKHGLVPDGIAGPKTLIRLNNVVSMPGIPRLSKPS
jgi:general secretion pathway protein A